MKDQMQDIPGLPVPAGIIEAMKYSEDLLWCDGPLMSKFLDPDGIPYVFSWVDCCADANRWLIWKTTEESILAYHKDGNDLCGLMKKAEVFMRVDIGGGFNHTNIRYVAREDVPEDYLPKGCSLKNNLQ